MKHNRLFGSPQMVWFGQGKRFGLGLSVLFCCLFGTSLNAQITPVGPSGGAVLAPQAVSIYFSVPDSTEIILVTAQGKPYFVTAGTNALVTQYNVTNFRRAFPGARFRYLRNLYTLTCDATAFGSNMKALNPAKFPFWEAKPVGALLGNYYPNDTATAQVPGTEWRYLDYMNAPRAWFVTKGSPNTIIGISDTYLDVNHQELSGKISQVGPNSPPGGYIDHGTAVSGIAAAATDNAYGMPSIGFNCRINFTSDWGGEEAMLKLSNDNVKVINGSWLNGKSLTYDPGSYIIAQGVYNTIYENGTVACFGAGNRGHGVPQHYAYPASLDHNISVSNIGWRVPYSGGPNDTVNIKDVYESIRGDSNNCYWRNDRVDILAPCSELILPTYDPTDSNKKFSMQWGTSFGSPITAGTVALMQTANPCLTPYQIEYILKKSAPSGILTLPENAKYAGRLGAGKLDAGLTLENVKKGKDPNFVTDSFGCNSPLTQTFKVAVDFNTLCAPGIGAGGLKPQLSLQLENGTPPYRYYWQPIDNNQTTLSSTTIANPQITSSQGSHIANYRITVYDASPIQKVASAVFKVQLLTNPNKAELALRDSYFDALDEPNTMYDIDRNHWDIWKSPDLWVRNAKDGGTTHQNPEYYLTDSNYVYARVRNVGCAVSTTSRISLFWTKASTREDWRDDWDGTISISGPNGLVPRGGIITESSSNEIPVLQPGTSYTYVHGWRPPAPGSYLTQSTHVDACILGRLLEPPSYMLNPVEVKSIKTNVFQHNNIVTRNLLITDLDPNNRPSGIRWVDIGNAQDAGQAFVFQFINDRNINKHHSGSYAAVGTIKVHLGPLYDRWVAGGMMGTTGLQVLPDEHAILIDGTEPLRLDNLNMAPKENFSVGIEFSLLPDAKVSEGQVFEFAVQQFLQTGAPGAALDLGEVYGAVDLQVVTHSGSQRPANQLQVAAPSLKSPMLDLYPNPAGDKLNVLYANLSGKQATVLIYDVVGRLMQQTRVNINTNRSEIDVQSLVPGLYILELRGEDGSSARKQFLKK